jgi:hypothetical protein
MAKRWTPRDAQEMPKRCPRDAGPQEMQKDIKNKWLTPRDATPRDAQEMPKRCKRCDPKRCPKRLRPQEINPRDLVADPKRFDFLYLLKYINAI